MKRKNSTLDYFLIIFGFFSLYFVHSIRNNYYKAPDSPKKFSEEETLLIQNDLQQLMSEIIVGIDQTPIKQVKKRDYGLDYISYEYSLDKVNVTDKIVQNIGNLSDINIRPANNSINGFKSLCSNKKQIKVYTMNYNLIVMVGFNIADYCNKL